MAEDITTLSGPVEKIDGELVLRIPLDAGGVEFVGCSQGIATIEGGELEGSNPQMACGKTIH